MSLVEVLFSMIMFIVFGATFIVVTEFTARFVREADDGLIGSQGLLIDHHKLQVAMDQIANVISQPGVTLQDIARIQEKGCVFDPMSGDINTSTGSWGLPGPALTLPPGYRFCLSPTSLAESSHQNIVTQDGKPGIYVLRAMPEYTSSAALPARRLVCRPKPFC